MEENTENKKNKREQIYRVIMVIAVTMFITCMVTAYSMAAYYTNNNKSGKTVVGEESNNTEEIVSDIEKFKSVVNKYYLGEVNDEKLKEGAIRGYIAGLEDPYTEYISKDEMKEYLENTMGNFEGIGIYMSKNTAENRIQIISVINESPAQKAGLLAGDLIKTVDGKEYVAEDLNSISSKIKGEANTKVKIEIIRDGKTIPFEINREKIIVNKVTGEILQDNIGYIKVPSFDETTSEEFKTKYEEQKSKNIKGLIIDLRNNGGGIVTEALKIADFIADKDSVLLYEINKNGKEIVQKAKEDPIINVPVIVLTNGNSASSSEILVGALKDLGKAKSVGTKTYGKGVIQQIISMKDGSGIKITTEEYQTPNKNKINKIGIEPDEKVELPENVNNKYNLSREEDNQLQKAIEMLK